MHPAVGVVAVGLLMVLTGFVVLGLLRPAAGEQNPGGQDSDASVVPAASPAGSGPLREVAFLPVDLAGQTANLPPGGPYSAAGRGTWHVIPDRAPVADGGAGRRVVTYTVEAEDGIDSGSYAGDDAFGDDVQAILADPRGWTATKNITLRRVASGIPTSGSA